MAALSSSLFQCHALSHSPSISISPSPLYPPSLPFSLAYFYDQQPRSVRHFFANGEHWNPNSADDYMPYLTTCEKYAENPIVDAAKDNAEWSGMFDNGDDGKQVCSKERINRKNLLRIFLTSRHINLTSPSFLLISPVFLLLYCPLARTPLVSIFHNYSPFSNIVRRERRRGAAKGRARHRAVHLRRHLAPLRHPLGLPLGHLPEHEQRGALQGGCGRVDAEKRKCLVSCICSLDDLYSHLPCASSVVPPRSLHVPPKKVHWFSIINSLMIVVFLAALVGMILLRAVYGDISRYNQRSDEVR